MDPVAMSDIKAYEVALFNFLAHSPLFKPHKFLVANVTDRKVMDLC